MKNTLKIKGDSLIVHLSGELDHHKSSRLREHIDSAIFNEDIKELFLISAT